ncbi:MAG: hypothetical protein Q9217_002667 [Psora testacea]
MSAVTPVDEIAEDDKQLVEKVEALINAKVTLDHTEVVTKDPTVVGSLIPALLVRVNGGEGAVRVDDGTYVRTGANQGGGYFIVTMKPGQICVLLGHPSVRYFYHNNS